MSGLVMNNFCVVKFAFIVFYRYPINSFLKTFQVDKLDHFVPIALIFSALIMSIKTLRRVNFRRTSRKLKFATNDLPLMKNGSSLTIQMKWLYLLCYSAFLFHIPLEIMLSQQHHRILFL